MSSLSRTLPWKRILQLTSLVAITISATAQNQAAPAPPARARTEVTVGKQGPLPVHEVFAPAMIERGGSLFQQNCAFCHGKDAGGGETGPDLTRSKLVSADTHGENISVVVKNGRPDKGMPPFNLSDAEIGSLVAFIHSQQDKAMSQTGSRKGVDDSDLQTGDVAAGKAYFDGVAGCSKCHSPTGDLAGVATRYQGQLLKLEESMLYPKDAKSTVAVTTSSGKVVTGTLSYLDEFTVGLTDQEGVYHSWPTVNVKYKVNDPAKAHVDLLDKYTDDDIHNLMAYLQTLR